MTPEHHATTETPNTEPLTRRWLFGVSVVVFVLAFVQAPGRLVADTKYDLTQNPLGFLERAAHQWSSLAPLGQVQNQAYGYFFPHGAFFGLGHVLHIPPWITQRIWWALLLVAGFWGIIRLAEALGVGSRSSRIIAATAFALSPRVLTTLGSISSETLPMMLAPWVLLPVVLALGPVSPFGPPGDQKDSRAAKLPQLAAQSAVAVALMGAVNAVATAAACLVAALWWVAHRPNRRWWVFTAWWIPLCLVATVWWIVPLLLLGRVSPPFLDYIESSGVTTQWTSLTEVLRGTDSWTPFVSPERIAGAVLVTQPAAVVATGALAAAGMAGLAMRSMPGKGRLVLILFVGLAGLGAGYVGELGSPIADTVRMFLDSGGAALRNVHKLEPLVRLPLVLGLAHLLAKVPLPGSVSAARWRSAFMHPEREPMVALTSLILVALTLATSLAWTGKLAPRGSYDGVPGYWHEAAEWLGENAAGDSPDGSDAVRALVVPGAPFASQVWGLTRDEPLQALATTPWASRDAVPLVPPGAIRALDSVQRLIADGSPSDGLAATLLGQGIGYVVVRNDLDPETSRSTRPLLVHRAIDGSPGLTRVASFGEDIGPAEVDGIVLDGDLYPRYPAIEIYRVTPPDGVAAPFGPYTVDLSAVPLVQGGPESLQRLAARRAQDGDGVPTGPVLLAADAARAGLPVDEVTVTDTPTDRETDFGQVDNHSSALRDPDDPRRTHNLVADYPVDGTELVTGRWEGARITVSSAASDATQLGGTAPGSGPAAVVDGDTATGWFSNGLESALGQWIRLEFDTPVTSGLLHLRTSAAALGVPVRQLEVTTANGSTAVKIGEPGEPVTVSLPPGRTDWVQITATRTEDGSVGTQFGISELSVDDYSDRANPVTVPIRHHTVLPQTPAGATVTGWDLGQELPGRTACVDGPDHVHCHPGLALQPEEPGVFERTLSVPQDTAVTPRLLVRSRQSAELAELLADPARARADGAAMVADVRGSAAAAVDGDERTSWTASRDSIRGTGAKPTVTVTLPEPVLVTGLELTPSLGALPARATRVAVNLGNGTQVRDLTDGDRIELLPTVTDRVVVSIVDWDDVLDQTALGFAQTQPPGFAEIGVLTTGDDGVPGLADAVTVAGTGIATEPPGDRVVTVGCENGPVISFAGSVLHTSVTATVDELRSGTPVPATVCGAESAAALPAGSPSVVVAPGAAFTVDSLRLDAAPPTADVQQRDPAATTAWTANRRELVVDTGDTDRLLVNPESANVGWVATAPDGTELTPVAVNGWQQGWILPAGTTGTVTLEFATDRWYRLGIFTGLLLLIPLFVLALWPRRRPAPDPGPAPRTWHGTTVAFVGVLATATVITGWAGALVTVSATVAVVALGRARGLRVAARTLVAAAGVGTAIGAALLSTGPWRFPGGYVGHSWLVQLAALIGVVAVGLSAVPLSPAASRLLRRRSSQRASASRAGSSTSA